MLSYLYSGDFVAADEIVHFLSNSICRHPRGALISSAMIYIAAPNNMLWFKLLILFLSCISIFLLCHPHRKSVSIGAGGNNVSYAAVLFYMLNPIILYSFYISYTIENIKIGYDVVILVQLMHHLLIFLSLLTMKYDYHFVSCILIGTSSIVYNPTYLLLLVFVANSYCRKHQQCTCVSTNVPNVSNVCLKPMHSLLACGILMIVVSFVSYSIVSSNELSMETLLVSMVDAFECNSQTSAGVISHIFERTSSCRWDARNKHYYQPSIGIWWYLQAQVFSSYTEYFQFLLRHQPTLYALPLVSRFQTCSGDDYSQIIVRFSNFELYCIVLPFILIQIRLCMYMLM